jgi:FkbM family methyltransferase
VGGALRGRWWLPESRGKVLRILGGTYEPEQTALFVKHLPTGGTVLDVGAHVGYYTLLSSVLVGPAGRVFAFEPNPANQRFLKRHAAVNGCANVTVVESAVSDATGTARFDFGSGSGTGHLAEGGAIEVRTVTLDEFCGREGLKPDAVKIDVEGAEAGVLRGGEATITSARPVVFLSTHGAEVHRRCLAWLRERGYALSPILGGDVETTTEVLCLPSGA